MRNFLFFLALLFSYSMVAQNLELNCNVVVDAQKTGNENVQIFKTLEKQLNEFVNNTKWTNKNFLPQERIDCSMVINVSSYDSDVFNATLQVSASRPVYNSTYSSPIYNFNDKDFSFRYLEFQNLNYSETQFESNLISVIAFHINLILGLDADTFALNGGNQYYLQARTIVGYSQQNNGSGWQPPKGGDQTRSALIDNILSPTYREFSDVMYQYHIDGLDMMSSDPKKGKENISSALKQFKSMNDRRPNSFILRVFFDAKADEIKDIYSAGPTVNVADLVDSLQRIAPMHANKWREITF